MCDNVWVRPVTAHVLTSFKCTDTFYSSWNKCMWSEGLYILRALQNIFVIWPKDTQNKKLMWSSLHCFSFCSLCANISWGLSDTYIYLQATYMNLIAENIGSSIKHAYFTYSSVTKGSPASCMSCICAGIVAQELDNEEHSGFGVKDAYIVFTFEHHKLKMCTGIA